MAGISDLTFRSMCTLLDHFSQKKMNQRQKNDLINNVDRLFRDLLLNLDTPETIEVKKAIESAVYDYTFNVIKLRTLPIVRMNLQTVFGGDSNENSVQWIEFIRSRINIENISRLLVDFAHDEILFCNSQLIYEDPFEQIDTIFKDLPFDGNNPYVEEYKSMIKMAFDGLIDDLDNSLKLPVLLRNLTSCLEGIVSENTVDWVDFMLAELCRENEPLDSSNLIRGPIRSSEIRLKYKQFRKKTLRMTPFLASKSVVFKECVYEAKKWFNLIGDYTWPFVFLFASLENEGVEQETSLRTVSLHFSAYISNKAKRHHINFDCTQHELVQICQEFMSSYLHNRTANLCDSYLKSCQKAQQHKSTKSNERALRKVAFPKGHAKVGRNKPKSQKHQVTQIAPDPFGQYCRKHREYEKKLTPRHFYGYPISAGMLKKSVIKALTACDEAWLREQYYCWNSDPKYMDIIRRSIDVLEAETVQKINEKRDELQEDFSHFETNFIPLIWKFKGSSKMDYETLKIIMEGHRIFTGLNDEKASLYRDIAYKIYDLSRISETQLVLIEKVKQWLLVRYLMENYDFRLNFPMRLRNYLKEYNQFMQNKPNKRVEEFSLQSQAYEEKTERGQLFEITPSPASCSTESSSLQLIGSRPLSKKSRRTQSMCGPSTPSSKRYSWDGPI